MLPGVCGVLGGWTIGPKRTGESSGMSLTLAVKPACLIELAYEPLRKREILGVESTGGGVASRSCVS